MMYVLVGQFPAVERRGWEPRVDFEDEALSVDADAEALARIFENLLANALRHGAAAPVIEQRGGGGTVAKLGAEPGAVGTEPPFQGL